jgi:hypothetical protein
MAGMSNSIAPRLVALVALAGLAFGAHAQNGAVRATQSGKPAATQKKQVIELPAAERDRIDPLTAKPLPPLTEPPTDETLPPARPTEPTTRIEQRRTGNRVTEIVVTPAGSTRSYVIVNREGQRPLSPQELSAGLSTPRFLRFDF